MLIENCRFEISDCRELELRLRSDICNLHLQSAISVHLRKSAARVPSSSVVCALTAAIIKNRNEAASVQILAAEAGCSRAAAPQHAGPGCRVPGRNRSDAAA